MRFIIMIGILIFAPLSNFPQDSAGFITGLTTFGLLYALICDIVELNIKLKKSN